MHTRGEVLSPPMMAPHSSSPPPARLSSETLDALRVALTRYARTSDEDGIREALRTLSAEARALAVPPEEVLVHLKQLWAAIPLPTLRSGVDEHARALQRVVTICIQEYFR